MLETNDTLYAIYDRKNKKYVKNGLGIGQVSIFHSLEKAKSKNGIGRFKPRDLKDMDLVIVKLIPEEV